MSILIALVGGTSDSKGPSAIPDASGSIRVVSASHEVGFPEQIELRLEAESDTEITGIRLLYSVGGREVLVYGYPQFTSDRQVSADYIIKTGGGSYIPTGVDIEYYYVIEDAGGHLLETERYSIRYTDPRYRWQELQLDNLVVLWHDRPRWQVASVATEVDRRLERVRTLFGLQDAPPMKAVILNDRREANRSFPRVSQTATTSHLFGGFAYGQYDLFVLIGLRIDGMVHEMTHLLLDEAVDSPRARVPSWLNEGLAQYFESDSHRRARTVERAARRGQLMPLASMAAVPGRPEDVALFYSQAWSVVSYLMDVHGEERMAVFIDTVNNVSGIDAAAVEAYGMTLAEIQRDWEATLTGAPVVRARQASDPVSADDTAAVVREAPGSQTSDVEDAAVAALSNAGVYGTPLLLAGAVGLAVVVTSTGWLVRRVRRQAEQVEADEELPY